MMMMIMIIANDNIQILQKKMISYWTHTQLARLWDGFKKYCRSILFYVLYVTFSLFVINVVQMLVTLHAIAYSPLTYGQYNN